MEARIDAKQRPIIRRRDVLELLAVLDEEIALLRDGPEPQVQGTIKHDVGGIEVENVSALDLRDDVRLPRPVPIPVLDERIDGPHLEPGQSRELAALPAAHAEVVNIETWMSRKTIADRGNRV